MWKIASSCARRHVWSETKEDTGQISGFYTLYDELRLISGELEKEGDAENGITP